MTAATLDLLLRPLKVSRPQKGSLRLRGGGLEWAPSSWKGAAVARASNFSAYNVSGQNAGVHFLSIQHIFLKLSCISSFPNERDLTWCSIPFLQNLLCEKKKKKIILPYF